ncbi:MAG TPA: lipopolysaccharide heptosyltransferase I [Xanthobacteraceae bacterium]|nr:lipopolysaccharide heptosyltransferase I [Xanthobacteraceae bacterium]
MKKFLFVKTSSMGDVIHHLPAITDTRRHHPDARITWLVEEPFAPLVRLHPAVDEVITVAVRRWRSHPFRAATWREFSEAKARLKASPFDRIIDAQGLIRSALLVKLAHGESHGYDAASIREPVASWFYDVRHAVSRSLHAVDRNRQITALSLGHAVDTPIDYGLPRSAPSGAAPYAVLLHGTSRASKEWRESDWIRLGKFLREKGLDVLLTWGNEAERLRSQRLAGGIKGSRILPRQPLDETAKVIAGASLVVGVDTGLLHLAAAYQVPSLGLFLSTDPGLTRPVGAGSIKILGGRGVYPECVDAMAASEELLGGTGAA